jgi:hypothetical protein
MFPEAGWSETVYVRRYACMTDCFLFLSLLPCVVVDHTFFGLRLCIVHIRSIIHTQTGRPDHNIDAPHRGLFRNVLVLNFSLIHCVQFLGNKIARYRHHFSLSVSVRPFASISLAATGRISVKFYIGYVH